MRTLSIILALLITVILTGFVYQPETPATGRCDEKEMARIDEIRFTIAHQLIDAKTVNATTDDGAELTAFYVGSELVKLSVDAKGFSKEIYVSGGFPVSFDVTNHGSDSSVTDTYYFKDYRLVCRVNPMTGEQFGPPDEPETDLIAGFEYYLNFIQ